MFLQTVIFCSVAPVGKCTKKEAENKDGEKEEKKNQETTKIEEKTKQKSKKVYKKVEELLVCFDIEIFKNILWYS